MKKLIRKKALKEKSCLLENCTCVRLSYWNPYLYEGVFDKIWFFTRSVISERVSWFSYYKLKINKIAKIKGKLGFKGNITQLDDLTKYLGPAFKKF